MYINKHKLIILVVLCVYDIRTKFPIIRGKQCRSSFTSMGMGGTKTPCISGFSLIYLFKRIVGNWSFLSSPESFSQAGILKSKEPGVWGWFSPICAVEDALIYTLLLWQLWTGGLQEWIVLSLFAREFYLFHWLSMLLKNLSLHMPPISK